MIYGTIKNGFVEEFVGNVLRYTKAEGNTMYYIQIINPTEKDFNDAGYYRLSCFEEGCFDEKALV